MSLTLQQSLHQAIQRLQEQGITSAQLDARLLLSHALELSVEYLIIHSNEALTPQQQQQFISLLKRRLQHEPLAHILGRREFWGLEFTVNAHVLDPRADSETLVQAVLNHIPDRQQPLTIADLGTGSGCLLLALLAELPNAQGTAIDISSEALEVARINAQRLNLADRVAFRHHDYSRGLSGHYDWIISNPPYIPSDDVGTLSPNVRLYEPHIALDGGKDGLDFYRYLATITKTSLKRFGKLAVEIGLNQKIAVEDNFIQAGFNLVNWSHDLAGIPRCGIFNAS